MTTVIAGRVELGLTLNKPAVNSHQTIHAAALGLGLTLHKPIVHANSDTIDPTAVLLHGQERDFTLNSHRRVTTLHATPRSFVLHQE